MSAQELTPAQQLLALELDAYQARQRWADAVEEGEPRVIVHARQTVAEDAEKTIYDFKRTDVDYLRSIAPPKERRAVDRELGLSRGMGL